MADETNTDAGKAGDGQTTTTVTQPDLSKAAEGLVAKHGDPTAALLVLLGENYKARDHARELKAKLPPDGALVIHGDDAKAWARYRALGDPRSLETALSERDQFRGQVEGHAREKLHNEAAAVSGFRPSVLSRLAGTDNLALEIVETRGKDGKPVRTAVVKGDGETTTPLAEYAETHWGEFLPALKADAGPTPKPLGSPVRRGETPPRPQTGPPAGSRQGVSEGTFAAPRRNVF